MAAVMIGVDPHKGSHTAVEIGPAEEPLGELRVLRRTEDPRHGGCHVHGISIAAARQVHAFRPQLKLRLPVPWAP